MIPAKPRFISGSYALNLDGDGPDDVLYNVLYGDGDTEDMRKKCRVTIDLYVELDSGDMNEWEIYVDGDE